MTTFGTIAKNYAACASLQKSASERLFALLAISNGEDVLDLGCGPGTLTQLIAERTNGRVAGCDISEGMVEQARNNITRRQIEFIAAAVETMQFDNEFDVVFCNSAFQWFARPQAALDNCYRALRPRGRMGVQAPATRTYCPNFQAAVNALTETPDTHDVFVNFQPPWLFANTAEEYASWFEGSRFHVDYANIEVVTQLYTPDKAIAAFHSGAAAGYLNPSCYSQPWPDGFLERAKLTISDAFYKQTNSDGLIPLTFKRIYLVALK
jgi:ubiquinone/menaquinone biosynthesis C-methylase UbiE